MLFESRLPAARRGALGVTFRGAVSMRRRRADEGGDREIAELAALADGSLAPEQRVALEARVAASSELADRLAEQQRAVALTRSAGRRGRGARGSARAHRGAATSTPRAVTPSSRPGRCRHDRRAGRRRGGGRERARFGHLRRELPRCPCIDRPVARSHRRGDAHQDLLGLADRARCHGASPPRRGTLLRGVAAGRRRRARAGRDVQRRRRGSRSGRAYRRRTSRR